LLKRKKNIILIPFLLIFSILFLFSNDVGIMKWYQLKNERNQLKLQINTLINKENELNKEINKLKTDTSYIKKIAQEKYFMVKPGEKIFRVVNKRNVK
tara:strand:- start:2522 stop:2815 length:294 start_codon:yes stop_codon:yes gene_type:complete